MPHVKLTSGHWNRLRLSDLLFQQIGTQDHFIRRDLFQMENFMQLIIQEHKGQSVWVAAGICTDVLMNLLGGTLNICLADAEGNEHCLVIGKDHKIYTGPSYRFYFRDSGGIFPVGTRFLKKHF